jgi:hypothetical protein
MAMNVLHLDFDLSDAAGVESGTDALSHELSLIVDAALKRSGQARWSASKVKDNRLQVKCSIHDPVLARAQIKWTLSSHWVARHLLPGH